jgi:hypothetical protein
MTSNVRYHRLLIVLAALPPLALALFVAKYGVSVPYCDSWDLVPLLEKSYTGQLTLHDLWAPHNEHRTFFPRLIMLGLARLTRWNIGYELALNLVIAAGIFALLSYQLCITARETGCPALRGLLPVVSLATFSLAQFENWLWGWQVQLFAGVLASVGSIMSLTNGNLTWRRFLLSGALGVFASYSFASGLVLWPLGFGLISMASVPTTRLRAQLLVAWSLMGLLTVLLYFHQHASPGQAGSLDRILDEPWDYLTYLANYLGGICTQYDLESAGAVERNEALFCGLGLMTGLALTYSVLVGHRITSNRVLLPYLGLAAYSLAAALVTGIARLHFGTVQALSSRYTTITVPAWIALLVFLVLLGNKSPPWRMVTSIFVLAVISLILVGSLIAVSPAKSLARRLAQNKAHLLSSDLDGLDEIYLPREAIAERYQILVRRHLALW